MSSYVYRGNQPGAAKGGRADIAEADFDTSKCGTYAGYHRHRRYGVYPCDACKAANRDYIARFREAQKVAA